MPGEPTEETFKPPAGAPKTPPVDDPAKAEPPKTKKKRKGFLKKLDEALWGSDDEEDEDDDSDDDDGDDDDGDDGE